MVELRQTTLRQPKPKPPKSSYASFLKDFVDPGCPGPCPNSVHTSVSEWLESIGSDREESCQSDSHLHRADDGPISRQLTRSAPEMAHTRDVDGFAMPSVPASIENRTDTDAASVAPSDVTGSARSSGRRSLVEDPLYRKANLAENNIYLRPLREQLPKHISDLIDDVRRDRDSPGPSPDQVSQDAALNELWMGAGESQVEDYFRDKIFPKTAPGDSLDRTHRQPMAKHTVPNSGSNLKVSNPVPDMLYGYSRYGAFSKAQQTQFNLMRNIMVANSQDSIYPFFVIEFKGDGPSGGGSMWVATNQCLGGSASCVNTAERLSRQSKRYKSDRIRPFDSAVFSIAMNGTQARLYISWKHNELDYYMASIDNFQLQKAEDYLEFRRWVLNIIDWGKNQRLKEICDALDSFLKESKTTTSETAISHQPPSDGSTASSNKRQKSSSTGKTSNKSESTK